MRDQSTSLEEKIRTLTRKTDSCWFWTGRSCRGGYGVLSLRKQDKVRLGIVRADKSYAHRVVWILHHGPIPMGMVVCHNCDQPSCVNQAHLFLGTYLQNSTDMVTKDRQAKGERVGTARLTAAVVRLIRWRSESQDPGLAGLSERFGVAVPTISKIVRRETWKHVV